MIIFFNYIFSDYSRAGTGFYVQTVDKLNKIESSYVSKQIIAVLNVTSL